MAACSSAEGSMVACSQRGRSIALLHPSPHSRRHTREAHPPSPHSRLRSTHPLRPVRERQPPRQTLGHAPRTTARGCRGERGVHAVYAYARVPPPRRRTHGSGNRVVATPSAPARQRRRTASGGAAPNRPTAATLAPCMLVSLDQSGGLGSNWSFSILVGSPSILGILADLGYCRQG